MLRSTWMLLLTMTFASMAHARAQVVIGVAGVDGDTTTVIAVPLDNGARGKQLGTVLHPAGDTPGGIVVDDDHLAVVMPAHGDLVIKDLRDGSEQTLTTGLMKNQRPRLMTTARGVGLVAVRGADDGVDGADVFEVVGIAPVDERADIEVLARVTAGWLTPVTVATKAKTGPTTAAFLSLGVGDEVGVARVRRWLRDGGLDDGVRLGTGIFRDGVVRLDGTLLIEQETTGPGHRRSSVIAVDGARTKTITTGLAGMSPIVGGARAALATGDKDGSLLVDGGDGRFARWPGARVGQARPQLITETGEVIVVVLVARGQSLPAELWAVTKKGGRLLYAPSAGDVVSVYGFRGATR